MAPVSRLVRLPTNALAAVGGRFSTSIPAVSPSITSNSSMRRCMATHTWSNGKFKFTAKAPPGKSRLRVISMDVTGTMVSFNGKLEEHYGHAARFCGVDMSECTDHHISESFRVAYKETSTAHPCFGNSTMSAKDWWRECVLRSFELAGARMTKDQAERVFQRVYSIFGSHATYSAFPDARPFLRWAHRRGIVCGIVSNADERYGDSILPMLGLADDLSFLCFSKEAGVQKPDRLIFETALRSAEPWLSQGCKWGQDAAPLLPSEVLHIGNDFEKDYIGARDAGFHAVLLNRYDEEEAHEWRKKGAPVHYDLIDVVESLARAGFTLG